MTDENLTLKDDGATITRIHIRDREADCMSHTSFGQSGYPRRDEEDASTVSRAQDLCRAAILHMVRGGALPNWDEVVLGRGYRRYR